MPELVCSLSMTGDPLSKLPVLHKQAVLATMDEVSYFVLSVYDIWYN